MTMDESCILLDHHLMTRVEAFDLRAVVEDTTATLLGHKYRSRGLDVRYIFSPELPARIVSDPRWVLSMVSNYMNNAVLHTQSRIVLRASLAGQLPVRAGAWANGGDREKAGTPPQLSLRVEVHDDGSGVPDAQKAKLFRPFSQLNPEARNGTGLGLASVKAQVEVMGGSCGIGDSEELGGALFWLVWVMAGVASAARRYPLRHACAQWRARPRTAPTHSLARSLRRLPGLSCPSRATSQRR